MPESSGGIDGLALVDGLVVSLVDGVLLVTMNRAELPDTRAWPLPVGRDAT